MGKAGARVGQPGQQPSREPCGRQMRGPAVCERHAGPVQAPCAGTYCCQAFDPRLYIFMFALNSCAFCFRAHEFRYAPAEMRCVQKQQVVPEWASCSASSWHPPWLGHV